MINLLKQQKNVRIFYICNKKARIADGSCDGYGCLDVDASENWDGYCSHTLDPNYALHDLETLTIDDFEIIVFNDEYGNRSMQCWEIDYDD